MFKKVKDMKVNHEYIIENDRLTLCKMKIIGGSGFNHQEPYYVLKFSNGKKIFKEWDDQFFEVPSEK